ncbi:unnamed protein product [Phaedon cochleariae]|uniref:C2H2-type domain-containing protein n=1 Tax=Phaedon cochleariae TaxID=80249 RepID=A0A9P0GQ47_PHACE|nr:unnamed protein product [Phaedon cochleariae]
MINWKRNTKLNFVESSLPRIARMTDEVAVGSILYICNICDHNCPDPQLMTDHMRQNHSFPTESDALNAVTAYMVQEASESSASTFTPSTSSTVNTENKLWPREATLGLIRLVEEYDGQFQKSVKKHVWTKISTILNSKMAIGVSWQQCDTKWKSLKKTYKDVKDHNSTSGKNRRKWEFYDEMHKILFNKPEISAPATCSSHAGLITDQQSEPTSPCSAPNKENMSESTPSTSSETFESNFIRKRKIAANAVERRHREKMQRQDRFLDSFEDFVKTYKSKN